MNEQIVFASLLAGVATTGIVWALLDAPEHEGDSGAATGETKKKKKKAETKKELLEKFRQESANATIKRKNGYIERQDRDVPIPGRNRK